MIIRKAHPNKLSSMCIAFVTRPIDNYVANYSIRTSPTCPTLLQVSTQIPRLRQSFENEQTADRFPSLSRLSSAVSL